MADHVNGNKDSNSLKRMADGAGPEAVAAKKARGGEADTANQVVVLPISATHSWGSGIRHPDETPSQVL